ncbi:MAG: hypothetical protein HQL64_08505 [Magnetococcales bacterium]|nr:hypothetical protein [Magnetococcales bacterium]
MSSDSQHPGLQGGMTGKLSRFAKGVAWLYLIVSIVLLVSFYYREKVVESYTGYYMNYLVSSAGIVFWWIVLRFRDEARLNIVLSFTSLLVGVYVAELALHVQVAWNVAKLSQRVTFDQRKPSQVLQEMKKDGKEVVLYISPADFAKKKALSGDGSIYPLGGISGKTTLFCNEGGRHLHYVSDRHGFNNPDAEWDVSQPEWLLTGDSFTQGFCVKPGEEISGQIRSRSGEHVLNVGSGGNGPLFDLAALKEYAESKRPRTVLWLYFEGNDLSDDLPFEKSIPTLMNYLQPGFTQNLLHRQTEIDGRLGKYVEQRIHDEAENPHRPVSATREIVFLHILRTILYETYKQRIIVDPIFSDILTQARDRATAWGGRLYFVYLPDFDRYKKMIVNHDDYKKRAEVTNLVKALQIPILDMHQEVFANHPDRFSLFPYQDIKTAHYNARGYAEVARAILAGVARERKNHPGQPSADKATHSYPFAVDAGTRQRGGGDETVRVGYGKEPTTQLTKLPR